MRKIVSIVLALVSSLAIQASSPTETGKLEPIRPVAKAFTLDYGGASVLDTYLSSIKYSGYNLRLGYERLQAMHFNPEKWVMQLEAGVDYANTLNPAQDLVFHTAMFDAKWGMMHRWRVVDGLQLFGGGSTQLRGGAIYAPVNSNNVVSVKAHWSVDLTAMAVYNRKFGELPITFRYQATLPVAGLMYSLDYGESYFELYEGNLSGLAHLSWVGNRFALNQLVAADLHLGNTILRFGYRGVYETSWVNNLNTQIFRHSLVLGLCGEWVNVPTNSKLSDKARVISSIY